MKKKNVLKRNLLWFALLFVTIFTIMFIIFSLVSAFIIEKGEILLRDAFLILGLSFVSSIVIFFIMKISLLNRYLQTLLIYFTLILTVLGLSIIMNIFNKNIVAYLITFGIAIIGLIIVTLIEFIRSHRENRLLNENLASYKGGHK